MIILFLPCLTSHTEIQNSSFGLKIENQIFLSKNWKPNFLFKDWKLDFCFVFFWNSKTVFWSLWETLILIYKKKKKEYIFGAKIQTPIWWLILTYFDLFWLIWLNLTHFYSIWLNLTHFDSFWLILTQFDSFWLWF